MSTGHLWIEEGQRVEGVVADVAPVLYGGRDRTYSYSVPAMLESAVSVGQRVRVPIGRRGRCVTGFVVSLDRRVWDSTLRPLDSTIDPHSFLTPELVALGREIARHYHCSLGRTLKALTPEAVRQGRGMVKVRYARGVRGVDQLEAAGERISSQRRALLDVLSRENEPVRVETLLDLTGTSASVLRAMVKANWVEIETRLEEPAAPHNGEDDLLQAEPDFEPNDEQRAALEAIGNALDAKRFGVTLLYGVSGSGKTEVYIRAMRRVVEAGRQAILLVPEIVLTTQLVTRLASRFHDVAVQHSGLTESQRSVIWRQVKSGEKTVVIGTRSAVFAPCPNLGLICVDEEQETSFKNLAAPRFHVRDVAIMRAQQLGIPVVLGSATPSLETWYRSERRRDYQRVELSRRVRDLPMPRVDVVDMDSECAEAKAPVVLSRLMEQLLGETLERNEQAVLLVNRRGFANRLVCPTCRTRLTCPNCNVGLVAHSATGQSLCHYCRTRIDTPTVCSNVSCGAKLVQFGVGTQRVESILAARFPGVRVRRVNSDTMKHRSHYREVVEEFSARKIDVLVGTQMIAKGLDFPFVSFVGMVEADLSGVSSDFRAHERLFQLVTQVAGRAGRADVAGRVVVQTTDPTLPAMRFALEHDYPAFAANELAVRERIGWPPFRRLMRVVLSHQREEVVRREAEALAERVGESIDALSLSYADVLGPSPCALSRLRGKYRYDLLVRVLNASDLRTLSDRLEASGALRTKAVSMMIDVDPVSLS